MGDVLACGVHALHFGEQYGLADLSELELAFPRMCSVTFPFVSRCR